MSKADKALRRLTTSEVDSSRLLAHIQLTTELETEEINTMRFIDCFKSTDLRRTIISIIIYAIQPLVANFLFIAYAVYFFELTGLHTPQAFNLGVGLLGLGFVGTSLSWPLITRLGRRAIYNYGLVTLVILVLMVGVLDAVPDYTTNTLII